MPLIKENIIQELSKSIQQSIGLYFPPKKHKELGVKIMELAKEQGHKDVNEFSEFLLKDIHNKSTKDLLAEKLTIGETYFYRDRELFRTLEEQILPDLIAKKEYLDKTIRIWSAACSSGEEAYTMAMLLQRLLPNYKDWNIVIRATDINLKALEKAKTGKYTEWSFRSCPTWIKQDFFRELGNSRYQLKESIKQMVSFSYLNLFDNTYPSMTNNTNAMDLILCRNVMIYFEISDIKKMSDKLYDCLVEDGLLLTTPSESYQYLSNRYHITNINNVTLYRHIREDEKKKLVPTKTEKNLSDQEFDKQAFDTALRKLRKDIKTKKHKEEIRKNPVPLPSSKLSTKPDPELTGSMFEKAQACFNQRDYYKALQFLNEHGVAENPEVLMLKIQICANLGNLTQALSFAEYASQKFKLKPEIHYLRAVVQTDLGMLREAKETLKKTLFLNHDFVIAHFTLAIIAYELNEMAEAKKHFTNTYNMLEKMNIDEIVPYSDDMIAGRLKEIVKDYLNNGNNRR